MVALSLLQQTRKLKQQIGLKKFAANSPKNLWLPAKKYFFYPWGGGDNHCDENCGHNLPLSYFSAPKCPDPLDVFSNCRGGK